MKRLYLTWPVRFGSRPASEDSPGPLERQIAEKRKDKAFADRRKRAIEAHADVLALLKQNGD